MARISAPAANAFSLPVSTITAMLSSASNWRICSATCAITSLLSAFKALGRFKRTTPTRSWVSTKISSSLTRPPNEIKILIMSHSSSMNIEYHLSFPDLAGHRIHVKMTIPKPDPQGQRFFLPAWIPGSYLIRDFSRQIEEITASSNDHPVDIQKYKDHEWVCAPCNGPLTLEYVVYAWDLSVRAARVDDHYAFFNGTSVFLAAKGHTQNKQVVILQAPSQHPDWQVFTSLPCAKEHSQAAQRHQFGAYIAKDYDALIDHPFLLGQPIVSTFHAHGALHELVFTQPVPNLDIERVTADVKQICEAQIELFEPEDKYVPFLDSARSEEHTSELQSRGHLVC